jgi:hypothetical protein
MATMCTSGAHSHTAYQDELHWKDANEAPTKSCVLQSALSQDAAVSRREKTPGVFRSITRLWFDMLFLRIAARRESRWEVVHRRRRERVARDADEW